MPTRQPAAATRRASACPAGRTFAVLILACLLALLTGCSPMKIEDFSDTNPKLSLEEYFTGTTRAWGIFQDRQGRPIRQFRVRIEGHVEDDTLVLDEHFDYADGEQDRRIWRLERVAPDRYVGRADDVVGTAEGVVRGQAFNFRYVLNVPWKDTTIRLNFDDWMFLQPDGVMINRATVRKFGFRVGEVILFFDKDNRDDRQQSAQTPNLP